jgi:RimJ/RimL family protein N-acetyltransferase
MLSEFPKLNYNVVYGSKAENTTKFENVNYYYELNADEMLDLMLKCHLAITAAGQTIYELARIGISTIAIGTADNQKYNLKGWVKMGFLEEELWIEQTDLLEKIKNHISKLKSSLSIERKVYCDGQGARRFINELLMPEIGNKFYFRKFTKDDITSIYNLSNEDEVRSFSINKSNISWETHQNWFNEKLKSNYAFYLITLTFKQELIGQIKFDIKNEMPEISISISKNFRGKGMSTHILQNACKLFFAVYPEKSEITAHIKEDNIKSIRSFEKTGFIFKGQKQINSRIFNYYILNKTTLNVN